MGRPAKEGVRRYIRLPETLWEQIDTIASQYALDYSFVVETGYILGREQESFLQRLGVTSYKALQDAIASLPHLESLRAIIAANGLLDARLLSKQGEIVVTMDSAAVWNQWNPLSTLTGQSLDHWLLKWLWPDAPKELSEAAQKEEIILDKEGNKWFLRILTGSKGLVTAINKLVADKKLAPRDDLNLGRYRLLLK